MPNECVKTLRKPASCIQYSLFVAARLRFASGSKKKNVRLLTEHLFHVLTGRPGRRNSSELGWRVVWLWSTHQNGHAEATECRCRRLFLASTVQLLKRLDEYTRGFVWSCSSDQRRSVCSSEWRSIILGCWWSSAI